MSSNPRKYTKAQIEMMEDMRYRLRMSLKSIALSFGTTRTDIERQFKNFGPAQEGKQKGLPVVTTWDFSKDNLKI